MEQFIHEIQHVAQIATNIIDAGAGLDLLAVSKEKCNFKYI
ncbi:hypothetical protein [Sphingobacterium haloxyli]|nr:hypothetical protein [Sphingobacterium haloxyli]